MKLNKSGSNEAFHSLNLKSKIMFMEMLTLLFYFLPRTGISLRKSAKTNLYLLRINRQERHGLLKWEGKPLSGFGFIVLWKYVIPIHISFRNYHQATSNIILVTHIPSFQLQLGCDRKWRWLGKRAFDFIISSSICISLTHWVQIGCEHDRRALLHKQGN